MRRTWAIGALALGLLLAGCSSPATTGSSAPPASSDGYGAGGGYGAGTSSTTASAGLKVAKTSLGEVVVTSTGMTAYVFDKDTKGTQKSACTGACAGLWPAILATGDTPRGEGISGTLGTIPTPDGKKQITLDGWPLYTYSGDTAAGDVHGQGLQGIWWVVNASGARVGG
ncbi:COG4315 family predicted lipoprotein [Microbacterium azadirachtae]|uniref:COG4315 family predicted lipoprotein n=1 Tax=Microbacterium azadirachtae TaxID=582680 RepID=UPI003F754FEB